MASLKEIQDFLKNISKMDLYKVKIESDEIKITVQLKPEVQAYTEVVTKQPVRQQVEVSSSVPAQQSVPEGDTTTEQQKSNSNKGDLLTIKSPLVGTFYRKPSPDKPPFVEVGQKIKKGDTVCIIEAMKIFNEIDSDYDGEIVEILVDDATPVEFDQPLFLVKPL